VRDAFSSRLRAEQRTGTRRHEEKRVVDVAFVEGAIQPISAIPRRRIDQATGPSSALVICMDTPGGLDKSIGRS